MTKMVEIMTVATEMATNATTMYMQNGDEPPTTNQNAAMLTYMPFK